MHGSIMQTSVTSMNNDLSYVRKVRELIAEMRTVDSPLHLFDEFWREGEIALFFGAASSGKSILAVQLADALARGRPLTGFRMPIKRRKVLYVDLGLSEIQFKERYGRYRFSENLYRGRPRSDDDLVLWIRNLVDESAFEVVIVDDLGAVKRTYDGIRETLTVMRQLRRLCREKGLSILAITSSEEPTNTWEREHDLKRLRVICTVADSVFSLGVRRTMRRERRLMQTRSRSTELFWNDKNAPIATIRPLGSGILGFEFDSRFAPFIEERKLERIRNVHWRREAGQTFTEIAKELGISRTLAHRLSRQWTPSIGGMPIDPGKNDAELVKEQTDTIKGCDSDADDKYDREICPDADIWLAEEHSPNSSEEGLPGQTAHSGVKEILAGRYLETKVIGSTDRDSDNANEVRNEQESSLLTAILQELEPDLDNYLRPIFVVKRDENSRTPIIWYTIDNFGQIRRHSRTVFGTRIENIPDEILRRDPTPKS